MKSMPISNPLFNLASSLFAITLISSNVHAGTFFWDGNGNSGGFGTAGGTWDSPTDGSGGQGWSPASGGGSGGGGVTGTIITTATTDSLNFGNTGASNQLATGTIAVAGSVNSGNMKFEAGSGQITLGSSIGSGTINFADATTVIVNTTGGASAATFNSVVSGASNRLTKTGVGTMVLAAANTYSGATIIEQGTITVNTIGSTTTAGGLGLSSSVIQMGNTDKQGVLVYTGGTETTDRQIQIGDAATGTGGAFFQLNGTADITFSATNFNTTTVSTYAGTRSLQFQAPAGNSAEVQGVIQDSSATTLTGIIKSGNSASTLILSGANTYTGASNVIAGHLVINGNISTSILTTVNNNGTLSGANGGTVGALTVSGGSINPGDNGLVAAGVGILNASGDYSQVTGTLNLDLNGTSVGAGYDQLNVTGTVTLGGLLAATVGYTPANGDLLFILANDGADAISGTFSGLAQGDMVNYGGFDWLISYEADTVGNTFLGGNDVALQAVPEPGAALLGSLGLLYLLRRRRA